MTEMPPATTSRRLPIVLRAAVVDKCNFSCVYCPKGDWSAGGMENYTPDSLVGETLTTAQYATALQQIHEVLGIDAVSFTGGEPTLNPQLGMILKGARSVFRKVEITTNGSNLSAKSLEDFESGGIRQVKVSFDTTDGSEFSAIVRSSNPGMRAKVAQGISMLRDAGFEVALNVVVMKRNLGILASVVDFARSTGCTVHLLDYVFYPSKRRDWEEQFVPLEHVAAALEAEYGSPIRIERYGCTFYSFTLGGTFVRFKDSMAGTTRATACATCAEYCQEGPYGLKLSTHGWVTACPSIDSSKGVSLAGVNASLAEERLLTLNKMFIGTQYDSGSFARFLEVHSLSPMVTRQDVMNALRDVDFDPVTT